MKRLKELREKRGMSQLELAELLRVKPATISRYETGSNEPDIATLKWYADYFNCSVDYLLGRTNNPRIHIQELPPEGDTPALKVRVEGDEPLTPEEEAYAKKIYGYVARRLGIDDKK